MAQTENITQRKEAEKRLMEERSFLKTLVNNVPVNIYTKDLLSRKTMVNQSEINTYSASNAEELLGKDDYAFYPPGIAQFNIAEDQEVYKTGKVILDKERLCVLKDGKERWFLISKIPLFNDKNRVTGLLGISYDITHLKKIQNTLQLSEEKFRLLYELSPVGIALNDFTTGSFIDCNKAIYNAAGYSNKEEFLNLTYWDLTPHEYEFQEAIQLESLNRTGQYGPYEKEYIRKDGTRYPVLLNGVKMKDAQGNDIILSVVEDITERKKQEQEITKATINAQEKERMEIGRELHDNINQILVGSILTLNMVKGDMSPSDESMIENSRTYIRTAIEEIRNLSHRLAPAFYDGIAYSNAFKSLVNNINISNQYKIILQIDEFDDNSLNNDILIHLYRILQEQLNNIVKYANATTINITITQEKDFIHMSIHDNGIGFDTNAEKKGIGLHNIKKRTELLSGTCHIKSAPNHGCQLDVEIPISQ